MGKRKRREFMDNLRKQNKAEESKMLPKQELKNSGVTIIKDKGYENYLAAKEADRKTEERRKAYMTEVYRQIDKLNEDKGDSDR